MQIQCFCLGKVIDYVDASRNNFFNRVASARRGAPYSRSTVRRSDCKPLLLRAYSLDVQQLLPPSHIFMKWTLGVPLAHSDNQHTSSQEVRLKKLKKSKTSWKIHSKKEHFVVQCTVTGCSDDGQVLSRSEEERTVAGEPWSLRGTKSLDSATQRNHSKNAAALQHRNTRRMNAVAKMQHALLTRSRLQAFILQFCCLKRLPWHTDRGIFRETLTEPRRYSSLNHCP